MSTQVQTQGKIQTCLLITRHKLMQTQEEDLRFVCEQIETKPEFQQTYNS